MIKARRIEKGLFIPYSSRGFFRVYQATNKIVLYTLSEHLSNELPHHVDVSIKVVPSVRDQEALNVIGRIRRFDKECARAVESRNNLVSKYQPQGIDSLLEYCSKATADCAAKVEDINVLEDVEKVFEGWQEFRKVGDWWMRVIRSSGKSQETGRGQDDRGHGDNVVLVRVGESKDCKEDGVTMTFTSLECYGFGVSDLYSVRLDEGEATAAAEDVRQVAREIKARNELLFIQGAYDVIMQEGKTPTPLFEKAIEKMEAQIMIGQCWKGNDSAASLESVVREILRPVMDTPSISSPTPTSNLSSNSNSESDEDEDEDEWLRSWWFFPSPSPAHTLEFCQSTLNFADGLLKLYADDAAFGGLWGDEGPESDGDMR